MSSQTIERPPAPSEVARNEAEAAKYRAEAEKFQAEARTAVAEAKKAELALIAAQHDADRAEEKRKRELSSDEHHHVYYFKGGVDDGSAQKCIDALNVWRRTEEPGGIDLVFFSPGGSVFAGMVLFDHIIAMRQEGWKFRTITRGYAASMGGILLQAGDERVCGPESYILIHEISSGAVGKVGELEDEVEFIRLIQKRVNDIFVARSNGKVTGAKLRAMYRRKDFWLDSKKALELGIVDAIG